MYHIGTLVFQCGRGQMAGKIERIIDGAIALIAEERGMPMTEIARRLGVGRTTLYRSFADREDVLEQVRREGARRIVKALAGSGEAGGSGLAMLEGCCERLFGLEAELALMLNENPLITDVDLAAAAAAEGGGDRENPIVVAVRRGHADGSIDPALPAQWIDTLLWTTLVAGRQFAASAGSRHRALNLVLHTMRRAVSPR